ncbi:MAG: DoxX family protein [Candidatus Omnitrophica bacterium]|nr:DoxX family protein [Candidatus Omnitrophota bacterium]
MFRYLIETKDDLAVFLLRLMLGIAFFPHGAQMVLGWFGGHGFSATLNGFTQGMHIPIIFALLAIAAEFIGSICLVLGLFTRVAAFGIAVVMAVAIYMVHAKYGFFMNWSGAQAGEGFEYHLLAIAIAVALMIKGGGSFSIDRNISNQ